MLPAAPLQAIPRRITKNAKQVRNNFCGNFNEEGEVEWQKRMVGLL